MNVINQEFETLYYKAATNKLDLKYLEEIQAFCDMYEAHADIETFKIRAKSLMSLIYVVNGLPEKSFEIDLKLLSQFSDEMLLTYYPRISHAVVTSTDIGRTDEVRPFALRYLLNKNADHWDSLLSILAWYIKHYSDSREVSDKFNDVFSSIALMMGYLPDPSASLADKVSSLSEERDRNHKNMKQFNSAYFKAANEDKGQVLSSYLETNPLPVFREMALRNFKNNPEN